MICSSPSKRRPTERATLTQCHILGNSNSVAAGCTQLWRMEGKVIEFLAQLRRAAVSASVVRPASPTRSYWLDDGICKGCLPQGIRLNVFIVLDALPESFEPYAWCRFGRGNRTGSIDKHPIAGI